MGEARERIREGETTDAVTEGQETLLITYLPPPPSPSHSVWDWVSVFHEFRL
jgi:hypothetical protein